MKTEVEIILDKMCKDLELKTTARVKQNYSFFCACAVDFWTPHESLRSKVKVLGRASIWFKSYRGSKFPIISLWEKFSKWPQGAELWVIRCPWAQGHIWFRFGPSRVKG